MSPMRLAAIAVIFFVASFAWFALGASVSLRSGEFDDRLTREVALLWGGPHTQAAPTAAIERPKVVTERIQQTERERTVTQDVTRTVQELNPIDLDSSRIDVELALDHRKKGLLWYDTYTVRLRATYRVRNPDPVARPVVASLAFPSQDVPFDNFAFRLNGVDAPRGGDYSKGTTVRAIVPAGADATLELQYDSRGLDAWLYAFAPQGIAQVKDFALTMRTNFDAIDFPAGTMSPSKSQRRDTGWELGWAFTNLVTGQRVGMDLPNRLNPGPLAARITHFAPVSLLFFMTVLVIMGVLRGQNLHPMNYAFLSAAFFAFHLLLAYLVDHLAIHTAFAIAAATSVVLVVTYLRVVAGPRFALLQAGAAQLVFLVLFSYAFFFDGYTGLTVTVGAVLTLFVLMQLTARLDWGVAFARRQTEGR